MYHPIIVLIYYICVFLYYVGPFILLIGGAVMFVIGMVKRFKTKNDLKPRGFALILAGALVFLPGGVICGGRGIKAINEAIDDYNNINHQLWKGSVEDVERLLKNGVNSNGESYSPDDMTLLLVDVAENGLCPDAAEKAALLIEYGADVNKLLCWRCDPNHRNDYHYELCSATPVLIACDSPNCEVLKVLIDNGGDVNVVDYYGYSALDIVERNIIDADERFHYSFTPVFEQMRNLLIENGAKNAVTDKDGKRWHY